jgi:hypothetical protein
MSANCLGLYFDFPAGRGSPPSFPFRFCRQQNDRKPPLFEIYTDHFISEKVKKTPCRQVLACPAGNIFVFLLFCFYEADRFCPEIIALHTLIHM